MREEQLRVINALKREHNVSFNEMFDGRIAFVAEENTTTCPTTISGVIEKHGWVSNVKKTINGDMFHAEPIKSPKFEQKRSRTHDVILRFYPDNITKEIKAHNIIGALQGYTDADFLYMHTVDDNTVEIGLFEREVK